VEGVETYTREGNDKANTGTVQWRKLSADGGRWDIGGGGGVK
jgi:hypothetical protein